MKKLSWSFGVLAVLLTIGGVASAIPYTFEFTTEEISDAINASGILPLDSNGIYQVAMTTYEWADASGLNYTIESVSLTGPETWYAYAASPRIAVFRDIPNTAPLSLLTDNPNYYAVADPGVWTITIDTDKVVDLVDWKIFVYGTPLNADGTDGGKDYGWYGGFDITKAPEGLQGSSLPPVPEPATITLCGAGLAALVIARRRKQS